MINIKFLVTGHLTKEERKALEERGLFCYELRDNDMGNDINSIEKNVTVNNVGAIVTDKEIKFGENSNDGKNYLEFIAQNEPVNTIEELLTNDLEKDIDI